MSTENNSGHLVAQPRRGYPHDAQTALKTVRNGTNIASGAATQGHFVSTPVYNRDVRTHWSINWILG